MVPTELRFEGPPVTPIDTMLRQICLPFPTIAMAPNTITEVLTPYKTLQQQFHSLIPPWKHVLFGFPWKAYSTKTLHKQLAANIPIMIVSNALVQNNGQSGFAWVIAQETTTLWQGQGLGPGPAADVYSVRAEAFGLFAALSFIQYYLSCYPLLQQKQQVSCFCDNSGVITSIMTLQNKTSVCPNETTNDDWDIYLAIHEATTQCNMIQFQYWHVKAIRTRTLTTN